MDEQAGKFCVGSGRSIRLDARYVPRSVADGRKLGQQRVNQVLSVRKSLETWSPESTLQKIRRKTASGGAAASSSAPKNPEPGAKRQKRVVEDEDDTIGETAIFEDASRVEGGAARHAPADDVLCFVPREILVKWLEGQDIVKLQEKSCMDEDELQKIPEEYRKEWSDLLHTITCRHKMVNPLAVWSNAVKVVPQQTVEHILNSVRFFGAAGKGADEQVEEDREKFVKYVHTCCCRECTEHLWDAYRHQMARRFVARQVVHGAVKMGSTPHELEAFLWDNKDHESRELRGSEWNWFPAAALFIASAGFLKYLIQEALC